MEQTLHGSCACGRIRYVVEIPVKQQQLGQLIYDNSSASRHHQASPLTLWLRVPLTWFHSATFAQFPDETHSSIQRTFTSPFQAAANARRQFCGYCGTQLTSWHERTRDDAEHINLTVGSLLDEDQDALGGLGLLPGDSSDEDTAVARPSAESALVQRFLQPPQNRGTPWFEELVQNRGVGRLKKQRGGHTSQNGSVRVEWEVVEYTGADDADDEGGAATPSKRKISVLEAEDAEMRNA